MGFQVLSRCLNILSWEATPVFFHFCFKQLRSNRDQFFPLRIDSVLAGFHNTGKESDIMYIQILWENLTDKIRMIFCAAT